MVRAAADWRFPVNKLITIAIAGTFGMAVFGCSSQTATSPVSSPAAANSASSGAASAPSSAFPDIVGTWTGPYSYPTLSGEVVDSTEQIIITDQEGPLFWGHTKWQEPKGEGTAQFVGTILPDGAGIRIAESAASFEGVVVGDKMNLVFLSSGEIVRTFAVELSRLP